MDSPHLVRTSSSLRLGLWLLLAVGPLATLPILAQTPRAGSGEVIAIREIQPKAGANVADFEQFVMKVYNPAWEGAIPGVRGYIARGDRGAQKGSYVLVLIFDSERTRNIIFPKEGGGASAAFAALVAGGMGEVYRARDTRLGRTVAIKFIRSDTAEATGARAQFVREGRAIAALNHRRICSVYDVGSFASENYLVMECLDGETVEQRLRRGRLPLDELFTVAIAVAEGLVAAHRAGIVHRDLKPANVMLTRDGPKLLDFGIVKQTLAGAVATDQETDKTVTAPSAITGRIAGTIPYMALEQLEGARTDGRTDVIAFGAMLFEMATGERAFGGVSAASQIAAIAPRLNNVTVGEPNLRAVGAWTV